MNERSCTRRQRLFFLCFPSNHTGYLPPTNPFRRAHDWISGHWSDSRHASTDGQVCALVFVLNLLPFAGGLRRRVGKCFHRRGVLGNMIYPCPVCDHITYVDSGEIPYPTCCSAACQDAVLMESIAATQERLHSANCEGCAHSGDDPRWTGCVELYNPDDDIPY